MPGTYSQILLHIVFSTKHREPWITAEIAERLYPYVGGIVRAEKGMLYIIGGIEDHATTRWWTLVRSHACEPIRALCYFSARM